jgi:FkbM family methyltransferase
MNHQAINSVYLSTARTWVRRLGLTRFVGLRARAEQRRQCAEYRRTRPSRAEVKVGRAQAVMLVADEVEYTRALSYREDRHIIQALVDRITVGDACWDIGANVGLYSVLMGSAVGPSGTVVSFEPEPRAYKRLTENAEASGLSNIRAFNMALGRDRRTMRIVPAEYASQGNHLLVEDAGGKVADGGSAATVDVLPGDELRRREGLPVPSAIKIDVEGAEEDVLTGLRETLADPSCRTIVCEVHFAVLEASGRGDVPRKILELLGSLGFGQLTWLDRSHLMACK